MKKSRRNFNKNYQLYKLASCDGVYRYLLNFIYFKDGFAYASDSHAAVQVPLNELMPLITEEEIKHLNDKLIHTSVYRLILKYGIINITPDGIECIGDFGRELYRFYEPKDAQKYPDILSIIAKAKEAKSSEIGKIGISPSILNALSQAMNTRNVVLTFNGECYPIGVKANLSDNKSFGVIMPARILNG